MPFEQFVPRSFTPVSVRASAPAASGLYGVSNAQEWIYIGETDNIQTALLDLQGGDSAPLKRCPTAFVFELCEPAGRRARQDRLILEYEPVCNRRLPGNETGGTAPTDSPVERKKEEGAKRQFILTGFTQAAGIRMYAFQSRVDARRIDCTVEVDLALIPGYGIRIQDLPLLCREFLQQRTEPDEITSLVFTEPHMKSHAEKLAIARENAEHGKKRPRPFVSADSGSAWRSPVR